MYKLTLKASERQAFDWVGDRYDTGYLVKKQLERCISEEQTWYDEGDITFNIPEHVAWDIHNLSQSENHRWPCFSDELRHKMQKFCNYII